MLKIVLNNGNVTFSCLICHNLPPQTNLVPLMCNLKAQYYLNKVLLHQEIIKDNFIKCVIDGLLDELCRLETFPRIFDQDITRLDSIIVILKIVTHEETVSF